MKSPSLKRLEEIVRERTVGAAERDRRNRYIADSVFATSPYLRDAAFTQFHPDDIRLLYELYDENYFAGSLRNCLGRDQITFRLSRRMTKAGGKTTRWSDPRRKREPWYEIAVSSTLLFQSFQDPQRDVTVTGIVCHSRLDGLMRIMEHELVHLIEMLVWTDSNCSLGRFQNIAGRQFGHTDHRHELMTPGEAAHTEFGIRPGARVRFDIEGHRFEGIVNRITRRATVLVPDDRGPTYSDGRRYQKFYVPLRLLEVVE